MKKLLLISLAAILLSACTQTYDYESVANDPMGVRIYTLSNGLKVYTSVNHDQPRIQAFVAVRAGSKNDPSSTTGLAHYFEHLMFKGTTHFGTTDYEAEKPLLDSIEALFEVYRMSTDSLERRAIYHMIDSISYEASKISIPNEYDKLMSAIGAEGCNAFTDWDRTCYVEDIPSNQLENWLKIQADRFTNPVLRGFHTELETVYEEFNMYASRDDDKATLALMSSLFPDHPYGRDIIGLPEHLKNPSIKHIKEFHAQWYVPNNMAVILSGDFNPDEAIAQVEKYMGQMKPNHELPKLHLNAASKVTAKDTTVYGLESEYVILGWRLPEASSEDATALQMLGNVLYNGSTGLVDMDLIQQQRVNDCQAGVHQLSDYGMMVAQVYPKSDQTLEEVRSFLLQEIDKLKQGDYSDQMLVGLINNYKKNLIQQSEDYASCAYSMLSSYTEGTSWEKNVKKLDELSQLTKDDLVAIANKYLSEDSCITVYKRQCATSNQKKIDKPQLKPIEANRDTASAFLKEICQSQVKPIAPLFLDFSKDISCRNVKPGLSLLYKQNTTNKLFSITYLFDMGQNQDAALGLAAQYLDYLGTSDMTPLQVKEAFFHIACDYSVTPGARTTYVTLNGLDESMEEAVALMEKLLSDAQVNADAYQNLVGDILKNRADAKLSKGIVSTRLINYLMYGPKNPSTNIVSQQHLLTMDPQELVDRIHNLASYEHKILYYGPRTDDEMATIMLQCHHTPSELKPTPTGGNVDFRPVDEPHVYLVDYDDNQSDLCMYAHLPVRYTAENKAMADLYNSYFGAGSMNCIVFQELRERRSLAYSAYAVFNTPSYKDNTHCYYAYIGTQNDKLMDATQAFTEIIRQMPQSQAAFDIAKESLLTSIRSNRTTKQNVLWRYIEAQNLGLDYDINERLYQEIQQLTLQDVVDYQTSHIKPLVFDIGVVSRRSDVNIEELGKYGKPVWLKLEDIFGY